MDLPEHPSTNIPNVVGGEELLAKHSAVSAEGRLRLVPIDGLILRQIRPVPHEDGHVTEVARASWPELVDPVVQVHVTTTLPGRIRAWGLHQKSTDRLFVVSGLVTIVVFDGRRDSPTGRGCSSSQPLSWLEKYRHVGGYHHQHADADV